jgi:nitrogen fixation protein NifB
MAPLSAPERSCGSTAGTHPCFDDAARHRYARLHLPVAPACNVQCNFCNRKYDCANESRPGVTSVLLDPQQAADYVDAALRHQPRLSVVGIAGPGDPFAEPKVTLDTLHLVRLRHPELLLCVASNGLAIAEHAPELAKLGVGHVTVTVNAVDPLIGARIYSWVRHEGRVLKGTDGAAALWERQQEGIRALKSVGLTVKVNTVIVRGVNDRHVPEIARTVRALGADLMNPIPLYPADGAVFTAEQAPDARELLRVKVEAGEHIPLMTHCARCRADAAGLLGKDDPVLAQILAQSASRVPAELVEIPVPAAPPLPLPRSRVAVASSDGLSVNEGLGKASRFLIFDLDGTGARLAGERPAPPKGEGRWTAIGELLSDCSALLVSEAGLRPAGLLAESGIKIEVVRGNLDELAHAALQGVSLEAWRAVSACATCSQGNKGPGAGNKACACSSGAPCSGGS